MAEGINWVEYQRSVPTGRSTTYKRRRVSINRWNRLMFSRLADETLGHPGAIVLLKDADAGVLGIRVATAEEDQRGHAYHVHRKAGVAVECGKAFLAWAGLAPGIFWDDVAVVDGILVLPIADARPLPERKRAIEAGSVW